MHNNLFMEAVFLIAGNIFPHPAIYLNKGLFFKGFITLTINKDVCK